ncbi:MAG: type II secretion system minor pseudopilin GspI [Pseudomonadota bacterium]
MRRNSSGFTLIEIMIAVAVFAVVAAVLIKSTATTARQTALLQDKTIAGWLAENQLAQLRIAPRDPTTFPAAGRNRFSVSMAGRDWEVMVDVQNTENTNVRRVEVAVYREDDLGDPVRSLTGFVGRF